MLSSALHIAEIMDFSIVKKNLLSVVCCLLTFLLSLRNII